ncbi:MAG: GNAT family N-acetyltransferase [Bergeyella sp.]
MKNVVWKAKSFDELNTSDLYKILQSRMEVFIIEQECHYLDLDDEDQKAIHFWAEENGEILAYCRIFDKGIKYPETSIGRVLTTEKGRGKGLGKKLVDYAVQIIENRFHTSEIRISAQDYLIQFYTDFGFQSTGKKYLEDDIPHTEMLRV